MAAKKKKRAAANKSRKTAAKTKEVRAERRGPPRKYTKEWLKQEAKVLCKWVDDILQNPYQIIRDGEKVVEIRPKLILLADFCHKRARDLKLPVYTYRNFQRWTELKDGKKADAPYRCPALRDALEFERSARRLLLIKYGAFGTMKEGFCKFLLSSWHRDEFSERVQLQHMGHNGGPVVVHAVTFEEAERLSPDDTNSE